MDTTTVLTTTKELLDPVMTKLGELTTEGFKFSVDILVRQQYVKVAQTGLGLVLWVAALLGAIKLFHCVGKWTDNDSGIQGGVMLVLGVVLLAIGFFLVCCLFDAVGILINPYYYALQDGVGLLKTVVGK